MSGVDKLRLSRSRDSAQNKILCSSGLQPKYWSDGCSDLFKCDLGISPFGLVECLCSELLEYSTYGGVPIPHVKYLLSEEETRKNGVVTVGSRNYCNDTFSEFSFSCLLRTYTGESDIKSVIQFLKDIIHIDVTDYLCGVLLLDYLFINRDRHWKNLAILIDGQTITTAPVFDNALAFDGANIMSPNIVRDSMEFLPFGGDQIKSVLELSGEKVLRVNYSEFLRKSDFQYYTRFYKSYLVDRIPYCLDEVLLSCVNSVIEVV